MPDSRAREPMPRDWSDAFGALPLETPPDGAWQRLAAALPPVQVTPPPLSQPRSTVTENAALSRKRPGRSRYFTCRLSSVCQRVRCSLPSVSAPTP